MIDSLSRQARSERMKLIAAKDTKPELLVRKLIHAMGFRYRLHRRDLPGTPDIVFPGKRKVIFVHGCFWHHHPDPSCKLSRLPKSRLEFWRPKLTANADRDTRAQQDLIELGWSYLVLWECELRDRALLERRIRAFLDDALH